MGDAQHEFREHLFFKAALYEKVKVPADTGGIWAAGHRHDGTCVACRRESTMQTTITRVRISGLGHDAGLPGSAIYHSGVTVVELLCSRKQEHSMVFAIVEKDGHMMKIGQWPSVADLGLNEIRRFDGVLSADGRKELATAIGLHAHGVGVGSFVYLRRILERLVHDAESRSAGPVDPQSRMVDRIKALKDAVPQFLIEKPFLYGILSKGVHELSDADCLRAFPVVRAAIEEVLDEEVARRFRAASRARTGKELEKLQKDLRPSGPGES